MIRLKLILSLLAFSGLALVAVLQYENLAKLRAENELLRGQLEDLSRAHAAPADASDANDSSAREQLSELLKLRGEVTRLREQSNQIEALKEANQKLAASLKELKASDIPKTKDPKEALPQDIHPRESWGFRGYATPEGTIESLFWAMVNGDTAATLEAYSPEERVKKEKAMAKTQEKMNDPRFASDEAEFAAKQKNVTEFQILDRRQVSDDEIVLTIHLTTSDANGKKIEDTGNPVFQRIGGEWKLTGAALR